ncbi:MarR family winged helix-turn-helix transcriptional regulator [Lentzea sp.]|uniref:MarR family winged helix-turn-helix transcriptional regulator n=1 Tax=Lentzea sp. TaxID=56099 RepID=UPI002D0DF6FC|nr:MarR family transcriptional regulator [Lentzea sp.]HUQ58545.1 MarR family transcriptional regulator [Lentzea sp.]
MGQGDMVGPLDRAVGYALKRAATALRVAMDAALRPLDLTVPQYSCLEVLSQRPGLSNAELARAVFVTRQSMNLVLRGLQDRGLVTRPATASHGRALPSELTSAGRTQLRAASIAVRAVEKRMLEPFSETRQNRLLQDLIACTDAVAVHDDGRETES